ncbi:glycosyl hydrolase family 28-related protein [Aeromicrobium piscarium]|uniref:Rhamnogalacturonase A/B/Epimerase-like pectate lyase domain-containing protein n=1 Tax=Aeromicrobium piscarium TaxID=2590901 RepID=A0A554SP54_9ACTN|nr:glycosyl hydrolase family 28-related protein [Aeromicrobium piscarium]TSD68142.1 hypothetical protein FNM00_00660 [Aeromicrobium piscarium]
MAIAWQTITDQYDIPVNFGDVDAWGDDVASSMRAQMTEVGVEADQLYYRTRGGDVLGPFQLPAAPGGTDAGVAAYVADGSSTPAALAGWDARRTTTRNVLDYGARGDGLADDTAAIQAALDAGGDVYLPAGIYLVSDELRVGSYTTLRGCGIDVSVIVAADSMPRRLNVVTNAKNTRSARPDSDVDTTLRVADLTILGSYDSRPTGGEWSGNASGVYLAGVADTVIERVKVVRAPLHGFAVDASFLPTPEQESPTFYASCPSRDVVIRDCIAIDSAVDDGFTTHYSHDIVIERCVATLANVNTASGGVQNGFEVDDGSWRVTVRDCVARGWQNGFQVKGHTTCPPAYDITIDACKAIGCACGFACAASHWSARNVTIRSCEVIGPADVGTDGNRGCSMKLYGYEDVFVRDFTIRDAPYGGIIMYTNGVIVLDGITAYSTFTTTTPPEGSSDGLIRVTGQATSNANIVIRDVRASTPIGAGHLIRVNAATDMLVTITNVVGAGPAANAAVSLPFYNAGHRVDRIQVSGFGGLVEFRGGSGATAGITGAPQVLTGTGDPNGRFFAPPGSMFLRTDGAAGTTLYVKTTPASSASWTAK